MQVASQRLQISVESKIEHVGRITPYIDHYGGRALALRRWQQVQAEWIKKQQHQPMAHRPPSSESARNALCKPDQRDHIR